MYESTTPQEFERETDRDAVLQRYALPRNDVGNGERLNSAIGQDLIFVPGRGWAVWNGRVFSFEGGYDEALQRASGLSDLVLEEDDRYRAWERAFEKIKDTEMGKEYWRNKSPKMAHAEYSHHCASYTSLRQFALRCGQHGKIKAALAQLRGKRSVPNAELDANPNHLCTPSGVVDLAAARSGISDVLKPHRRDGYPTRQTAVPFRAGAEAPGWDRMMATIFPDADTRRAAQRAFGACLAGRNEAHIALMFQGEGGNGKSTITRALSRILGSYAAPCKIEMFLATGRRPVNEATPDEAGLPGARAYIASEPGFADTLDGAAIKGLTGGDRRTTRALHKAPFSYTPVGVPIISFNRLPCIREDDAGTWRRLVFLPFTVNLRSLPRAMRLTDSEIDRILAREGPGIFNWLIDGYADFARRLKSGSSNQPGIDPSPEMRALKARARASRGTVELFMREATREETGARLSRGEVYSRYLTWCTEQNLTPKAQRDFISETDALGHDSGKSNGRMIYRNRTWL